MTRFFGFTFHRSEEPLLLSSYPHRSISPAFKNSAWMRPVKGANGREDGHSFTQCKREPPTGVFAGVASHAPDRDCMPTPCNSLPPSSSRLLNPLLRFPAQPQALLLRQKSPTLRGLPLAREPALGLRFHDAWGSPVHDAGPATILATSRSRPRRPFFHARLVPRCAESPESHPALFATPPVRGEPGQWLCGCSKKPACGLPRRLGPLAHHDFLPRRGPSVRADYHARRRARLDETAPGVRRDGDVVPGVRPRRS